MSTTKLLVAAALLLAACGHEGANLSGADKVAPPDGASAPAPNPHAGMSSPPAGDPHAANPHAGNPHMGGAQPPVAQIQAPLAWTAPQGWKGGPSAKPMRVAEFDVGADESGGAVQCILYAGISGSDEQNLSRWIGQMGAGAKDTAKTTHVDHDGLTITRLEAHGSYEDSMSREPKTVDKATMLAAIVDANGAKVFVKLVGASSVVDGAATKFDEFLASMKPR